MNESQFADLFQMYADGLRASSTSERRIHEGPAPRSQRKLIRGVVWSLTAGVSAWLLIIGVGGTPKKAEANAMIRIDAAVRRVHTMHVYEETGTSIHSVDIWRQAGDWRTEWETGPHDRRIVITKGKTQFLFFGGSGITHQLPYNGPSVPDPRLTANSPLGYALAQLDVYSPHVRFRTRVVERPDMDGPNTYRIVVDEDSGDAKSTIVLDKRTDLPIWQTYSNIDSRMLRFGQIRLRYEYPPSAPAGTFDPPTTPLDVEAAQDQILKRWREPIGKYGTTSIRDVSINKDGVAFVVFSGPYDAPEPWTLSDELGTEYAPADEYGVGGIWYDPELPKRFAYSNCPIRVQEFVAVRSPRALPQQILIGFHYPIGFTGHKTAYASLPGGVEAPCRRLSTARPEYWTAMMLDWDQVEDREGQAKACASQLQSEGKLTDAVRWKLEEFRQDQIHRPDIAHRLLRPTIVMLEKLGRHREAQLWRAKERELAQLDPDPTERRENPAP